MLYDEALAAQDAGDAALARDLLLAVIRLEPQHAGAWLDLSLLACAKGDSATARALMEEILTRFDPPPALRAMIEQRSAAPCGAPQSLPPWRLGAARGHESNVNSGTRASVVVLNAGAETLSLPLDASLRPRGDTFDEFWGETVLPLSGSTQLRAGLLARTYARERDFDLRGTSLSLESGLGEGRWGGVARLTWMSSQQGGAPFLETYSAGWTGRTPFTPGGLATDYEVTLTQTRYAPDPNFDAIGLTGRVGFAGRLGERANWQANAILSADRAAGRRPGGDRAGGGAELLASAQIVPGIRLSFAGRVLQMDSRAEYFPPLLPVRRRQRVTTARLECAVDLGAHLQWVSVWNGTDSTDRLPFLAYRSAMLQTGLVLAF